MMNMLNKIKASAWIVAFGIAGAASAQQAKLTSYVNPLIGTAKMGHTFPGATVPFGMVQLSPDNKSKGWDWTSGYHYSDSELLGFSHTHLSGTGVGDLYPSIEKAHASATLKVAAIESGVTPFRNSLSRPPKSRSMAAARSQLGLPPDAPMISQNMV